MSSPHPGQDRSDPARPAGRMSTALRDFLRTEVAGGAFLFVAALAALLWAGFAFPSYRSFWTGPLSGDLARFGLPEHLRALINDGLMTLFFFVVGLEIKRELVSGELMDRRAAALPALAAAGGMAAPAAIYLLMTGAGARHGWGIPMATDIAFALGVLTLFGRGLPQSLRVLLLTLAVADDIGTLIVITVFYAGDVRWPYVIAVILVLAALRFLAHQRRGRPAVYVLSGGLLWWLTLRSGVPPTVAGVALGLLIPSGVRAVEEVEHLLHPWTSFVILPLFALANAGLPIMSSGIGAAVGSEVTRAVLVGRIAGKFAGISLGAWIAIRLGLGVLPREVGWRHIAALGFVASVGFTIPLFVTTLAFRTAALADDAKLGILLATGSGFLLGGLALRIAAWSGRRARE